eukprot:4160062-Amphidinium_carterae.1
MGLAPLVELQQLDLYETKVRRGVGKAHHTEWGLAMPPPKKARQMQRSTKEWRIIRRSGTQILTKV